MKTPLKVQQYWLVPVDLIRPTNIEIVIFKLLEIDYLLFFGSFGPSAF